MSMKLMSPNEEQSTMMNAFGELLSTAFDLLVKHELGAGAEIIAEKLQEAMFWHNHVLLNKDNMAPVAPIEGDVIPKTVQ